MTGFRGRSLASVNCQTRAPGWTAVRLYNGHWLLVYNDTQDGRNSLAVFCFRRRKDVRGNGRGIWNSTTKVPITIQPSFRGKTKQIHAVYSYFVEGGKSMKHVAFSESWGSTGGCRLTAASFRSGAILRQTFEIGGNSRPATTPVAEPGQFLFVRRGWQVRFRRVFRRQPIR